MKRPTLIAEKALLHPLWVLSLVVLLVNDHYLKGTGRAPGAVTGKLSDLAGYLLFPMLLATVFRVRTRAGAAWAHLATAAVMLVLELSPAACAFLGRALGIGQWADPTDLVALGSVALSWLVLVPAAERVEPARRALSRALAVMGGVASIADIPIDDDTPSVPPSFEPNLPQLAESFLWNRTSSDIQVRVSAPRQELLLSCDDVLRIGPAPLFRASHFRVVRNVVVVANGRISLDGFQRGDCTVLLVEADGAPAQVVAWKRRFGERTDIANAPLDGQGIEIEQTALSRALTVPEGYQSGVLRTTASSPGAGCTPPPPYSDPAWADPFPGGDTAWKLLSATRGADGCDAFKMQLDGGAETRTWYLCIDPLPLPFVPGDLLQFRRPQGSAAPGVVVQSAGAIVTAVAGPGAPDGLLPSCPPVVHGCVVGSQRMTSLSTPAGTVMLGSGDIRMMKGNGYDVTAHVAHAEAIHVVDQTCDGSAAVGNYESYAWVARKEKP